LRHLGILQDAQTETRLVERGGITYEMNVSRIGHSQQTEEPPAGGLPIDQSSDSPAGEATPASVDPAPAEGQHSDEVGAEPAEGDEPDPPGDAFEGSAPEPKVVHAAAKPTPSKGTWGPPPKDQHGKGRIIPQHLRELFADEKLKDEARRLREL